MKLHIILLMLMCASLHANPKVGIVQIYNFLGAPVVPELKGKPLVINAIPSQQASSALLVPSGSHRLRIMADDQEVGSYQLKLADRDSVILAVIPEGESCVITEIPKVKKKGSLLIVSHSKQKHHISISGQDTIIAPDQERLIEDVKSGEISFDGGEQEFLTLEEAPSHSLILWSGESETLRHGLIQNFIHTFPDGLRSDFTFGRKRNEIKGLKTLSPIVPNN